MDKEINLFKGKTFTELTQGLTKEKRDYLYFRLMGEGIGDSASRAHRVRQMPAKWRSTDVGFRELEEHLLKNQEIYRAEAVGDYNLRISSGLRAILLDWVEKGQDKVIELSEKEKDRLLKLAEMMGRLYGSPPPQGEKETYEGRIKRLRDGRE